MAFSQSLAGVLGRGLRSHPGFILAGTFGLGAGAYAGVSTAMGTQGSLSSRVDRGADSAVKYGIAGLGVAGVGLMANRFAGFSVGQATGQAVRSAGSGAVGYGRTLASELASGGWAKTITRAPVVFGAGAGIGALLGAHLNRDNPSRGAAVGGAIGGVAGLGVMKAARATRAWGKIPGFGKFGILAAAAGAIGVAAHSAMPNAYEAVDSPDREQLATPNNMQRRMDLIGASGDLVLGLHNRR